MINSIALMISHSCKRSANVIRAIGRKIRLPFVSRKKHQELQEEFAQENLNNRILATKLKRIQDLCEDHINNRIGNLRFATIVKQVVDKR